MYSIYLLKKSRVLKVVCGMEAAVEDKTQKEESKGE